MLHCLPALCSVESFYTVSASSNRHRFSLLADSSHISLGDHIELETKNTEKKERRLVNRSENEVSDSSSQLERARVRKASFGGRKLVDRVTQLLPCNVLDTWQYILLLTIQWTSLVS